MYFDAHTHLNDDKLYPHWQQYMQNFSDLGGKGLVNVGVDMEWSRRAVDIAQQSLLHFPDIVVKATAGYHPSEICFQKVTNIDTAMIVLHNFCDTYKEHVVAIGECGIDVHYPGEKHLDQQKELFVAQCHLARALHLPVVIHSRDDFTSTRDVIKDFTDLKIYFHCRGYGPNELQFLVQELSQVWFGFDGNITYPKAHTLRESLLTCPIDRVLLETDAPYLSPQEKRGQTNEPANIVLLYDYIANLLSLSSDSFSPLIAQNFYNLYNIK